MSSTAVILAWDIWLRKRTLILVLIGIVLFSCLFNIALPEVRDSKADFGLFNFHLTAAAILLVLAIFSYTEVNPQTGRDGFPYRLFVLPVTTVRLVAIPMILGVAAVEVVILAWTLFVFPPEDRSLWTAIQLGVYMVLYQTVLWTLPALKSLRLLVIGMVGVFMILLRAFPFVQALPDTAVIGLLGIATLTAFSISWMYVARERSGGRSTGATVASLTAAVSDRMPLRRDRMFRSPQDAQFWFEWRRSGSVLPVMVGALLVLIIAPVSWWLRNDAVGSLRLMMAVLAMPMVLAVAVGKAFSKPEFWSKELSIPAFIAVRPLATADVVAIKLKVAAASTAIAWLLVLAFLSLWLPFWANLDSLTIIRGTLWMIQGHRLYPQYAIAALSAIACVLLTWRFMVGGLWLGLSGNTRVFAFSAFPYVVVPLVLLPAVLIAQQPMLRWIQYNTRQWLPAAAWIAAAAFVTKFWLAAFSWRAIKPHYVRRYLSVWVGGTACLVALAFSLGRLLGSVLPVDNYRLTSLLVLVALQIMPLARLGLAPSFLDKNRHR